MIQNNWPEQILRYAVEVAGDDAVGEVLEVDAVGQVEVLDVVVGAARLGHEALRRRHEHLWEPVDQHLKKRNGFVTGGNTLK